MNLPPDSAQKIVLVTALFAAAMLAWPTPTARAHFQPEIELARPEPPSVVDPGPDAAVLRVRVTDGKTGEPA
ncbi:MAG TPA: hypothetical protein VJ417_13750, partial [Candidatus Glassbacteria bacterium]|nr:hypothetical protein [Candidatus Glassbacteria bacterium]